MKKRIEKDLLPPILDGVLAAILLIAKIKGVSRQNVFCLVSERYLDGRPPARLHEWLIQRGRQPNGEATLRLQQFLWDAAEEYGARRLAWAVGKVRRGKPV